MVFEGKACMAAQTLAVLGVEVDALEFQRFLRPVGVRQ